MIEIVENVINEINGHNDINGIWSGRADLNGRPPAPKAGALTRLRYAPTYSVKSQYLNPKKNLN